MSLLDDLQAATEPSAVPCKVGRYVAALDESEREALLAALDNPSMSNVAIADIMSRNGMKVSSHTVRKHRGAGEGCSCVAQ